MCKKINNTILINRLEKNFKKYISIMSRASNYKTSQKDIVESLLLELKSIFNYNNNIKTAPIYSEIMHNKIILLIGATLRMFRDYSERFGEKRILFAVDHQIKERKEKLYENLDKCVEYISFDLKNMTRLEFVRFILKELSSDTVQKYMNNISDSYSIDMLPHTFYSTNNIIKEEKIPYIYFKENINNITLQNSIIMLVKYLSASVGRKYKGFYKDFLSDLYTNLKEYK